MARNTELITWLSINAWRDNGDVFLPENQPDYMGIEARIEGLIKFVRREITDDGKSMVVFHLTDEGKRELGIGASESNNTIIVLNPGEEHLLRLIAQKPRDTRYKVTYEHAVKGLLEYGFVYCSNTDELLFITKAGEQWLAEHDKSPETDTGTLDDVLIVSEWLVGNPVDGIPFVYGQTTKNYYCYSLRFPDEADELAETLNTYAEETARLRRFYDKSQPALLAAHDYIKKHGLGLGGEDVVMLVLEDARRLRRELAKADQQNSQIAAEANKLRENRHDTEEGLRNQNHDLEMRNAELAALLRRIKRELASAESFPELHETIETTLNEPDDDLPF